MPLAGLLDDAFIIGLCIKCFSTDLQQYKVWKYGESALDEEEEEKSKEDYDEADYEILDDEEDNRK